MKLRPWQHNALKDWNASHDDFALAACPGAGKTIFAFAAALEELNQGTVTRVHIIVPTRMLVSQFIKAAAENGLKLVPGDNGSRFATEPSGYHGIVSTYQSVAASPKLYRMRATGCLLIADEVHHMGDNKSWGTAMQESYEYAGRRLLMTGTPWRADNNPIPFMTYEQNGKLNVTRQYTFKDAWEEPEQHRPIRFINFHKVDAVTEWIGQGGARQVRLSECTSEDEPAAISNAVKAGSSWWNETFKQANTLLNQKRLTVHDSAGVIFASNQTHAALLVDAVMAATGTRPALIISDNADGDKELETFANGTEAWAVSVRQISEGTDIPRVSTLIYATNYTTPLFFTQAAGRAIRRRNNDGLYADMFIPAAPSLVEHARRIEDMLQHALREKEAREGSGGGGGPSRERVDLGNFDANYVGVEGRNGATASAATVSQIASYMPESARHYAPAVAAGLVSDGVISDQPDEPPKVQFETRKQLEDEVESLSRKRDRLFGLKPGETNYTLKSMWQVGRKMASDTQLKAQSKWIKRSLEDAL